MGNAILAALQMDPKKSVYAARNILFQAPFLHDVMKRLEENPFSVIEDLNEYRSKCTFTFKVTSQNPCVYLFIYGSMLF